MSTHLSLDDLVYLQPQAKEELEGLRAEIAGLRKDCDSENHLLRLALDREEGLRAEVERLREENAGMLAAGGYEHMRAQIVDLERKADAARGNAELIASERDSLRTSRDKLEDALRDAMRAVEKSSGKAELADKHAAWIRRGPPLDHGNTQHDEDWYREYAALDQREEKA